MKRLFLIGLILLLPLPALAGLRLFACEPEWAALAREIGGDEVDVFTATHARQDPHRIQARPSLIARARQADLLLCTGAGLEEGWLPQVLAQSGNARIQPGQPDHIQAAALLPRLLEVPDSVDRSHGHVHAAGNPHIQLSPDSYPPVARALAARLEAIAPARAGHWRARLADFLDRWQGHSEHWRQQVAPLSGLPVAVQHRMWAYLLTWAGLEEVAALEPFPGALPTRTSLDAALARVRADGARGVLVASYEDPQPARWLASQAGIPAIELPASVGGMAGTDSLAGLFDVIVKGLQALGRPLDLPAR